jgi:Gram-negative bacterial TonB protein C-terminal
MKKLTFFAAVALFFINAIPNLCGTAWQQSEATKGKPVSPELAEASRLSEQVVSLHNQRKFNEALPLAMRALEIRESQLGSQHVDETGNVISTRAVCGPDLLVPAAVEAARNWRFSPTLLSGVPIKVIGTITFNFNL